MLNLKDRFIIKGFITLYEKDLKDREFIDLEVLSLEYFNISDEDIKAAYMIIYMSSGRIVVLKDTREKVVHTRIYERGRAKTRK